MELCQNDSKTAESIKEARAICIHATLDAEALYSAAVKEAKATCAHTVWKPKLFAPQPSGMLRPGSLPG